jgi:hypothetical protein
MNITQIFYNYDSVLQEFSQICEENKNNLYSSDTIMRITNLKTFLKKVFSTQSKKAVELRMAKIAENNEGLLQTCEAYFSIANLVLGVRHLAEWEEEVSELILSGKTTEPCLKQILKHCLDKSFFIKLGYRPLIANFEFLNKLLNDLRMSNSVCNYINKLSKIISKNHEVETKSKFPMTDEEWKDKSKLLQEVIFLSCFSKLFHSKLQSALINVLFHFHESKCTDLKKLDCDIFNTLKELEETKAFVAELKRNIRNKDFFRNLVCPPLPPKRTDFRSLHFTRLSLV